MIYPQWLQGNGVYPDWLASVALVVAISHFAKYQIVMMKRR